MDAIEKECYNIWNKAPIEVLQYARERLLEEMERFKDREERYRKELFIITTIINQRP